MNPDDTKLMVFGSPQTICEPLSFKLSFQGKENLLSKIQTPLKACDNFHTKGSTKQNRSVLLLAQQELRRLWIFQVNDLIWADSCC